MIPCIATAISISIGIEKFTLIKGFGIFISVGGAVLVEVFKIKSDNTSSTNDMYIGTAILCIQVFFMASLVVFQKPILPKYEPCIVCFLYYSIGTLLTILLCAAWSFQFIPSDFSFDNHLLPWIGLLYAVFFGTVYTYSALSWAVKRLSPSVTTVYNTFQPVGTIFLSFLVLGNMITLTDGIGAFLVIIGLLITVYGQRNEQKEYELQENSIIINSNYNLLSESQYLPSIDNNEDDLIEVQRNPVLRI